MGGSANYISSSSGSLGTPMSSLRCTVFTFFRASWYAVHEVPLTFLEVCQVQGRMCSRVGLLSVCFFEGHREFPGITTAKFIRLESYGTLLFFLITPLYWVPVRFLITVD